jgi:hypothetical protein
MGDIVAFSAGLKHLLKAGWANAALNLSSPESLGRRLKFDSQAVKRDNGMATISVDLLAYFAQDGENPHKAIYL